MAPPTMQETWVRSLGWEDPLEEGTATPQFWPGKSHGQRSLAGCSPWDHKESDMTEHAYTNLVRETFYTIEEICVLLWGQLEL